VEVEVNKRVAIGAAIAVLGLLVVSGIGLLVAGDGDRRLGALPTADPAETWVLQVGSQTVGQLASVETCGPRAELVDHRTQDPSGTPVLTSTAGRRANTPCILRFKPFGMDTALFDWLRQTLAGQPTKKNLTLHAYDAIGNGLVRLELQNSLIKQILFPRLTGGNANAYLITLTVQPETVVRDESFSGGMQANPGENVAAFEFRLAGQTLNTVRAVGPIVVNQALVPYVMSTAQGGTRYLYTVGDLTVEHVDVTIDRDRTSMLESWLTSFVIQGQAGANDHKAATLELLKGNQQVGLTFTFASLGVVGAADNAGLTERTYSLFLRTNRSLGLIIPPPASPPPPPPPPTTAPPPPPPPPTTAPPPPPPPPPPPTEPPPPSEGGLAAPTDVVAKLVSEETATIEWQPVEGAEKYIVLHSTNQEEWTEVAGTEKTIAEVTLVSEARNLFVVRAVSAEGVSPDSEIVEPTR
jgi:hypothetical protein